LVVNLCDPGDQESVAHIQATFGERMLSVTPEDGENKIVFAVKGRRCWVEDSSADELAKRFEADYVLIPSAVQS
jgi:hypothetical protein